MSDDRGNDRADFFGILRMTIGGSLKVFGKMKCVIDFDQKIREPYLAPL